MTALSSLGIAHCSILTDRPVGVNTSTSNPAAFKWSIVTSISTGWFPVENFLPLAMVRFLSSVHTISTFLVPVYGAG